MPRAEPNEQAFIMCPEIPLPRGVVAHLKRGLSPLGGDFLLGYLVVFLSLPVQVLSWCVYIEQASGIRLFLGVLSFHPHSCRDGLMRMLNLRAAVDSPFQSANEEVGRGRDICQLPGTVYTFVCDCA